MSIIAPYVTSLTISKLSSDSVQITWDDAGENFYYFVEYSENKSGIWSSLGYTSENSWFSSDLFPNSNYIFRVAVAAEGFEQSEWVETESFKTFDKNVYTFDVMNELSLNKTFIDEKFINGNNNYVNFNNDNIYAALTNENFINSDSYSHISQMSNFIIKENEYHEVQGNITSICNGLDRSYLMEDSGVLYLFERWQSIVKVSNDRGQTWKSVKLLNDRVGWPLSSTVFYQTHNTSYVLGWDRIFYGRPSSDTRFSEDTVKFSSDDITFAKIGDTLKLGFDVNIFATYAKLPGDVSTIVESITCNSEYVYVVARDKVRFVKSSNAPVDTDPLSPTFGEKLFESEFHNITGNSKAVTWKMDVIDDRVFALVIGEVKSDKLDPRDKDNIIDSLDKGVYILEDHAAGKWTRVFGNTEEERRRIELGFTNMSCDDKEIFISSSNYKVLDSDIVKDPDLVNKYPDQVNDAVKFLYEEQYIHDKHYMMASFRANATDGWDKWKSGRMRYYAEPFFSKCTRSKTRCWVNNSWNIVMVYSDIIHEYSLDPTNGNSNYRIIKENWDVGNCTVVFPNVEFNNFTQYASGVIFYKRSGELIGYYEFNYRVKDNVRIVWKPSNIFLYATMQEQFLPNNWVPNEELNPTPDLRPFLRKIIPDSYLLEGSTFEKFCEYYLQYISDGYGTSYNNLVNLIKNKYPKEEHSWEYLWSEIYKRNIYLNKDKRDLVSRFFETRKNDFYSTKGTVDSYKFLFKVLYNEDVEVDIESANNLEYDVIVESDNISDDLVGRTIYTATGRCNVTYIERHYNKGKLQWKVTIHNLLGRFIEGQEIKSEKTSFEGMIVQGVRGKDMTSNTIEYINRSRSYYVMKIKSVLPSSRYRDDVLRFVHPVGFGFIGITLITMFINAGLSMKHTESIINKLKNYKWDSGLPSVYPDRVAKLDVNGKIEHDPITGDALYSVTSNAGEAFPLRSDYIENNPGLAHGLDADQRRKPMSPLFDSSATTFSKFRELVNLRLKGNIGNPRDPVNPTQVKVDE